MTVPRYLQFRHRWSRPWRARVIASALVAACAIAAATPTLHATVIIPADVTELATEASAIAHGRVVRVEAQQGEGRRVERLVTLQVFEYFKGGWGNVVQFRIPGGTLGRYQTVMIGAPELGEGDEVVLFLGLREQPFILGLHQGLFRVVTEEASGRRLVMPPLVQGAGVATTVEASASTPTKRGDVNRRPLELREFQARIAAALAAPRVAKAGADAAVAGRKAGAR